MQNKTEFLNCKCRFKDIFWDFEQWKKWVIEPLITLNKIDNKDEVVDWLNDTKTIYTQEQIYTRIYREFHFLVFKSTNFQDIIYNLTNILEHQLQQLYLNSLGLIDNALSEFKNKNKQIRKNINQNQSKQKNKVSVTPTDLTVKDDLAEMPINQADFGESFNESINFTDDQLLIIKKMLSFELPNLFEKIKIALMPLFSQIIDKKDEVDPLNQELIDINNDINNLYQKNERLETIINNIINNEAVDFEKLFEKINAIDVDKINENIESEKQERKQADIDLQNNIDNLDTKIFNELGNTTELINEVETRLTEKDSEIDNRVTQTRNDLNTFKQNMGYWRFVDGVDTWEFTSKKLYSTSMNDLSDGEIVNKQFLNWKVNSVTTPIVENVNNVTETIEKAITVNDKTTLNQTTEYNTSVENNDLELVNKKYLRENGASVDLSDYAKLNGVNEYYSLNNFNNLQNYNYKLSINNRTSLEKTRFTLENIENQNIAINMIKFTDYGINLKNYKGWETEYIFGDTPTFTYGDTYYSLLYKPKNSLIENAPWKFLSNNSMLRIDITDADIIKKLIDDDFFKMSNLTIKIIATDGRIVLTEPMSMVVSADGSTINLWLGTMAFFLTNIARVIVNIEWIKV